MNDLKAILITTAHKGVWYAEVPADYDLTARTFTDLRNARCAIYWGTTGGVQEFAVKGPNAKSRIGIACDIDVLHDITAVWPISDAARKAWVTA